MRQAGCGHRGANPVHEYTGTDTVIDEVHIECTLHIRIGHTALAGGHHPSGAVPLHVGKRKMECEQIRRKHAAAWIPDNQIEIPG